MQVNCRNNVSPNQRGGDDDVTRGSHDHAKKRAGRVRSVLGEAVLRNYSATMRGCSTVSSSLSAYEKWARAGTASGAEVSGAAVAVCTGAGETGGEGVAPVGAEGGARRGMGLSVALVGETGEARWMTVADAATGGGGEGEAAGPASGEPDATMRACATNSAAARGDAEEAAAGEGDAEGVNDSALSLAFGDDKAPDCTERGELAAAAAAPAPAPAVCTTVPVVSSCWTSMPASRIRCLSSS